VRRWHFAELQRYFPAIFGTHFKTALMLKMARGFSRWSNE
jgi:hypothetical protein